MPYVLQHKETEQLYTSLLVNHYELAYYGVKFWLEAEEAEREAGPFLQAKEVADPAAWGVISLEERELKLCNVKLKNDPRLTLYWRADRRADVQ